MFRLLKRIAGQAAFASRLGKPALINLRAGEANDLQRFVF
jgi:hypothetical protein